MSGRRHCGDEVVVLNTENECVNFELAIVRAWLTVMIFIENLLPFLVLVKRPNYVLRCFLGTHKEAG